MRVPVKMRFLIQFGRQVMSKTRAPIATRQTRVSRLLTAGVALAGTLGSVLGTLPLYFIGKAFGEERIVKWADKHGA